ncbi:MAG: PH domain-containing protein [Lysobacteraceae bacterium]
MTPQSESTPHPIDPATADAIAPEPALDATEVAIPASDAAPGWSGSSEWQRLPQRAYRVFLYVAVFVALPPTLFISASLYTNRFRHDWTWLAMAGLWVASISLVLWVAHKRYRHTFWKLDADGFAVRRGRLWQWETRVPTSRVQHLDIKRGPLERAHRLASLVLHTAGTRLNAVSISGLDDADAECLRNYFSRQIDRQEDDDHANA